MIDLHCHVLPGIDDGPATVEQSLELAAAAAAGGVRKIVATPHVSLDYRNDAATIARLVAQLNATLATDAGLGVEIVAGAEIAVTHVADLPAEELVALRLGAGPWLLLEPPFTTIATGFDAATLALMRAGHRIVIAHPERCPAFHRDTLMLMSLVRAGALLSLTAGSLAGRFGGPPQRLARQLLEAGLAHNVASDAHDASRRRPGLATEIEQAGFGDLREWLTELVPAAILAGDEIPPRPPHAPRRRRGGLKTRLLRRT